MAIYRLFSRIQCFSNMKSPCNPHSLTFQGNSRSCKGIFYNDRLKTGRETSVASCSNQSAIPDSRGLEALLSTLTNEEKLKLVTILQNEMKASHSSFAFQPPTKKQLFQVGIHHALPFVGFGFLDNFIMIVAGDYIDLTIGTMFGISTMAAAALGNTISDVAGVGSAQFVETFAARLGVPSPNLDQKQMSLHSVVWSINIGRAIGVTIGCILGMAPLLFLPTVEKLGC